jgi:hypothetical protein
MKLLIDILGWIAMILVLGSYFLSLNKKITTDSFSYLICNFLGGLFFVINTGFYGAYPSAWLNLFWMSFTIPKIVYLCKAKFKVLTMKDPS